LGVVTLMVTVLQLLIAIVGASTFLVAMGVGIFKFLVCHGRGL
jgi:hypothetical protein